MQTTTCGLAGARAAWVRAVTGIVALAGCVAFAAPTISTADWPGKISAGYQSRPQVAVVGYNFRYQIQAAATSFGAQGLPAGLSVDPGTGVISGQPATAGKYTVTLQAWASDGSSATADVQLEVQPAPTEKPVVDAVAPIAFRYQGYMGQDLGVRQFLINASNYPTSYDATGLPKGAWCDQTAGVVYYDINNATAGRYDVVLSATNAVGTGTTAVHFDITPTLFDNGISPAQGLYQLGDTVVFKTTFSGPVVVTGTPYLLISNRHFDYTSGSGTAELTFEYKTTAADANAMATLPAPYTIQLNGGTIQSPDGLDAGLSCKQARETAWPECGVAAPQVRGVDPNYHGIVGKPYSIAIGNRDAVASYRIVSGTLPAGLALDGKTGTISGTPTESGNPTVTIEATNVNGIAVLGDVTVAIQPPPTSGAGPTVVSITAPASGYLPRSFAVTVHFSAAVTVVGEPVLPISIGHTASDALYSSGTGTSDLVFTYTLNSPYDNGPLSLGTAVLLNGGTIRDASGRDAVLNFTPPDTSGAIADSTPPQPPFVWAGIPNDGHPILYGDAENDVKVTVSLVGDSRTWTTSANLYPSNESASWRVDITDPLPAGKYNFTVRCTDAAGNESSTTGVTVVEPTSGVGTPPGVKNADLVLQTGKFLNQFKVAALSGPASFAAPGLEAYGLYMTFDGVVFGTPPHDASGVPVTVYAYNADGWTSKGTLTLWISADGSAAPPPTNTPPPTDNPPPTNTPPPPTSSKSDQMITFSSPVSAIIVGQPITLGALSSAGLPITYTVVSGDATIAGDVLTPKSTATLVVRASSDGDATHNAASVDVNFGAPQKAAQSIALATQSGTVPAEKPVALSATASSGLPVTYTVVSGPATINGTTLTFTGTGAVVVRASQPGDGTYASASDATLTFTATPVGRLVNLSSRLRVSGSDSAHAAIAGFAVTGSAPKQMLIRAVGPSLTAFGLSNPLPDPELKLYDSKNTLVATNRGWNNDAKIAAAADGVSAFALGSGSKDAALLLTLEPGLYTAQVGSSQSGTVLIEVYDVAANAAVPTKQLINISTRGYVGTGDDVLVAGFVVAGNDPKRVLIRGIGPTLGTFGVTGTLNDPMLIVYDAKHVVVAQNDNWGTPQPVTGQTAASAADIDAADTASGAFGLTSGSADAAVIVTLPPGQYSVIVSGANSTSGAAMVEVYELP